VRRMDRHRARRIKVLLFSGCKSRAANCVAPAGRYRSDAGKKQNRRGLRDRPLPWRLGEPTRRHENERFSGLEPPEESDEPAVPEEPWSPWPPCDNCPRQVMIAARKRARFPIISRARSRVFISRAIIMTCLEVQAEAARPRMARGSRGVFGWVCTSNPFYVLSALLVCLGLWVSFGS
jgi:hypothetical protein